MKKNHKIYDEYNIELELDNSSRLYKAWNDKWLDYLRNSNGIYENQLLKDIKFNIIEHYTEDGLEKGDFDPSSKKTIRDGLLLHRYSTVSLAESIQRVCLQSRYLKILIQFHYLSRCI